MLFNFLNFSQFVVCMLGYKKIYNITNLKVHSKGRYFVKKKNFEELQKMARLDYSIVFRCLWYHKAAHENIIKINPAYGNSTGWRVGENAWLGGAVLKRRLNCSPITMHWDS